MDMYSQIVNTSPLHANKLQPHSSPFSGSNHHQQVTPPPPGPTPPPLLLDLVQVTEQLFRTMHMMDGTAGLTSPRMVGKVLRHLVSATFAKLWSTLQPGTGSSDAQDA